VSKHVILKYSPKLHFVRDYGIERGNRVMEILDEIENQDQTQENNET
jgi:ribosome-binding factor A